MFRTKAAQALSGLLGLVLLTLHGETVSAQGLKPKGEVRLEEAWNPKPEPDDLELPMPCNAQMVFKAVCIQSEGYLWDQDTMYGCDQCNREGREYYERKYGGRISGPFDWKDFPEAWRNKLSVKDNEKRHCYLIGKYEVTQLQWRAIMENRCPGASDPLTPLDALPKTEISWYEAVEFTQRYTSWLLKEAPNRLPGFPADRKNVGFIRLPTEAEWEYAARGGHKASMESHRQEEFFDRKAHPLTHFAVYRPEGAAKVEERPQRIGSRAPNPLGLYDTAGNVAEMVFDVFRFSLAGRLHGSAGGFVRKGGGFLSGEGEIMPGRREEAAFFQMEGPTKAKDLGVRVAISGINTPGGTRPSVLEKEWLKAGEKPALILDRAKDPIEEIDRLARNAKTESEKQNLAHIRSILKDNNLALAEQQKEVANGLIRSYVYAIEITRNYAIRRLVAKHQLTNIEEEIAENKRKNMDINLDKPKDNVKSQIQRLDKNVDTSLSYYRGILAESRKYPQEVYDAQFLVVQRDFQKNDQFTKSLQENLQLSKKHVDLMRSPKVDLIPQDTLRKDILEEKLR